MSRVRWAVLAVVVLLLAGCSEVPTSGPVKNGSTEGPNDTTIVYQPYPPAQGESKQDIVTGFITAASAGGDFRVAKEYLTSSFATKWKPRSRVLVQEAQPTITTTGTSELRLQLPISATVQADGRYIPSSSSKTVPLDFHLTQRNGQWRIDSAPDGIVLGQEVFGKIYVPRALDFFDPTYSRLVPDWRWFPVSSSSSSSGAPSASTVVDALIAGPAGPIAGGVAANALHGATVEAVESLTGDVTEVALSMPGGGDVSTTVSTRIQQQLVQSLQLPSSSALRLIVNGRVPPQGKPLASPTVSSAAYVVSSGRFGTLTADGTFTEDKTLGKRIVALNPQDVTVSEGQGMAAVLTGENDVAVVTGSGTRTLDSRSDLIAPTVDQEGWVYSVPRDEPGGLIATNAKGQGIDLGGNLGSGTITAIEASPDGTRLLVLRQTAAGPAAYVAGILRDADGTPAGLTTARYAVDLGGTVGQGEDATWVDNADVAVLVLAPDGSTDRVRTQQLGGLGTALGEVPNAESIVGTSSTKDLRIRLQSGDLLIPTNSVWQSESTRPVDVSVLAVQR